ncbi:hypothetical protein FACS189427_09930 [Planctomycetales bacterium]|nr:hypothetical protein FACS189427_09930 [Planctomycetales bacterium]
MRIIVLLFLPLLFIGCSQSPPELKKLRSVTITVTDNGKPLEGVLVALANKSPQTPRGCSGLTIASGIARIATSLGSHSVLGAAPGEYKVVLEKAVEFPPELQSSDEELLPKKNDKSAQQSEKRF